MPFLCCAFTDFLVTWAGSGYRTERDLFLARGVLQLLCLGNLRAANIVRERFLSRQTSDKGAPDSPLSNFLRFLLLTLEVRCCICAALRVLFSYLQAPG